MQRYMPDRDGGLLAILIMHNFLLKVQAVSQATSKPLQSGISALLKLGVKRSSTCLAGPSGAGSLTVLRE